MCCQSQVLTVQIQFITYDSQFTMDLLQFNLREGILRIQYQIQMEANTSKLELLKTRIKTFTHDYYVMQLPQKNLRVQFQRKFPFYGQTLDFRGQKIQYSPIGRIYGTNQFGQKCCCHIHGYFPSLYIKLDQFAEYMKCDANKIQFLNIVQGLFQEAYNIRKPIIYKGQIEEKLDFYGYHSQKQMFLKIYLYNPSDTLKMRELMGSKTIQNKFFQCYQAHINYFMQMFTDLNILGIHQMNICNFSFRKNLPLMKMFNKIQPKLHKGLMREGWNVEQLYLTNPKHFNNLQKMSSCYLQIDFSFQSILNQFEDDNDIWSDNDQSSQNCSQMQGVKEESQMIQMNVKVTTALNQIWRDQVKRRQKFGIKDKPYSFIDYSNNIQSQIRRFQKQKQQGKQDKKQRDAFWISFLNKGTNLEDLKNMIKSYVISRPLPQKSQLNVIGLSNYNDQLHRHKQDLINKVKARWDFYATRKNNIISEIMRGDRDQLPQWQDDYVDEDQEGAADIDEDQLEEQQGTTMYSSLSIATCNKLDQSQKMSKQTTLFGKLKPERKPQKSLNPFQIMMRKQTNTVKYRNNFSPKDFKFKEEGIFSKCSKCRLIYEQCWCNYSQDCFLRPQMSIEQKNKVKSQVYKYQIKPPQFQEIKSEKVQTTYQRPYFSDFSDLLIQYNRSQLIPDLKVAQNIDRNVVYPKDGDRKPITIRDDLKLPYFYLTFQAPFRDNVVVRDYLFKYDQKPPAFEQVLKQVKPNFNKAERGQSRLSLAKFEDTFVSDLILMKYEILVDVSDRNKFYGNPQNDKIRAIFFQLSNYQNYYKTIKCLIFSEDTFNKDEISYQDFDEIFSVKNQLGILQMWINIVIRVDIDLLITFDQEKRGIYYLLFRSIQYGIDLTEVISRSGSLEDCLQFINFKDYQCLKQTNLKKQYLSYGQLEQEVDPVEYKKNSQATIAYLNLIKQKTVQRKNRAPELRKRYSFNIQLRGRVNINLCRICESQLKLKSYTIQNVAKHMFRTQFCELTDKYLNTLVQSNDVPNKKFVQNYFLDKINLMNLITHELNIIGGILQKSKIYGADFVSMMQRGSQFKIEAVMCRVTKKRGYLTLSATRNQVANQSVLECRSLVIQPPKQFYEQPVLLFDFQSLYPSIMIAYNLCYSTCLGSLKQLFKEGKLKKMGVSQKLSIDLQQFSKIMEDKQPQELNKILMDSIFVTPNRVAFVKMNVKEGLIPQILLQFLMTRIMIKKSMKLYKKQSINHLLKQRQTALKLFMNVMYGYTGASFTGRMPCSQIADSVVQVSKYCLKQSIDYLNNHQKFKGKVIYGDTDSIFFHLPGAKLQDCFQIGKRLALQITKLFPYPMEMKFQKVYESLVLVSKKRYYGKSYQSAQTKPKYEGKGLECVRRDGIQLTSNLMGKMINTLIDTKDLSEIKRIFVDEYISTKKGIKLQMDLSLAKQVKFLKYSQKTMPAHGHAAKRFQQIDPIMLPKYGQRIKYVVTQSFKNAVKQRSIPMFEYLYKNQTRKQLDYEYYINKLVLPPIHRVFVSLTSLQKFLYKNIYKAQNMNLKKQSLEERKHNQATNQRQENLQLHVFRETCQKICKNCIDSQKVDLNQCIQLNCKVLYLRKRVKQISSLKQKNKIDFEKNNKQIGKRKLPLAMIGE